MPLTNATEVALLAHLFGKSTFTPPATYYIALSTTVPTSTGGNFTEPTAPSYARLASTQADWNNPVGGDPSTISTSAVKTFTTPAEDWATSGTPVVAFGLFSTSTGGTCLMYGSLTTPKTILSGDPVLFPAGSLVGKIGKPGDTF